MKTRNFVISVAAGLTLAAPALAGGLAGQGGGFARDPEQHQIESEPAGPAQEKSIGTACPSGPLLEELIDSSTGNGANSRRDARIHYEAIEGRRGIISL